MSANPEPAATDDEPVPKLPRGRGFKFSGPELFRVALTVVTLVGVIVLARPCANAVSGFVTSMDGSGSAGAAKQMPKPGTVDQPQAFEQLKPGMTEAEIKAAIERSKARASGGSVAPGSAAPGSAAPGSATPGGAAP